MDRDQQEFMQGIEKADRLIDLLKQYERENNGCGVYVLIAS